MKRLAALLVMAAVGLLIFGCTLLNGDPVAVFSVVPGSGAAPLAVQVNASSSFDPDGDALTYAWDFGDGGDATGVGATHLYSAEGSYTIRLTVTDSNGRANTATNIVTVTSAGDMPVASFVASPSTGGTPLTVLFNAAASKDPNGTITAYFWDFGDGRFGSGASPLHTYSIQGTYTATLTVTDNDGLTDMMSLVIVVIDGGQGGCR